MEKRQFTNNSEIKGVDGSKIMLEVACSARNPNPVLNAKPANWAKSLDVIRNCRMRRGLLQWVPEVISIPLSDSISIPPRQHKGRGKFVMTVRANRRLPEAIAPLV